MASQFPVASSGCWRAGAEGLESEGIRHELWTAETFLIWLKAGTSSDAPVTFFFTNRRGYGGQVAKQAPCFSTRGSGRLVGEMTLVPGSSLYLRFG